MGQPSRISQFESGQPNATNQLNMSTPQTRINHPSTINPRIVTSQSNVPNPSFERNQQAASMQNPQVIVEHQ